MTHPYLTLVSRHPEAGTVLELTILSDHVPKGRVSQWKKNA